MSYKCFLFIYYKKIYLNLKTIHLENLYMQQNYILLEIEDKQIQREYIYIYMIMFYQII